MSETRDERLRRAAEEGDREGVEAALAEGADLASRDRTAGYTALHLAASRGQLEVVELLLSKGADPLANDAGTMNPLHVAARDGKTKVVRLLLAKVRYSSSVLRDVLFVASGSVRGRPEVVALIETALVDVHRQEAGLPPVRASEASDRDAGADPGATPDEELIRAVRREDPAGVRRALGRGAAPDVADPDGTTPLLSVSHTGNEEIARLLVAGGADVRQRDASGKTPLLIACAAGHGRLATDLIEAGAEVEVESHDGYTPLMGAARSDEKALVELLLARGADPTHTFVGGNTAASIASRGLYGDGSLVKLLRQAELLWCLKDQRRYLRNFAHAYSSRPGQKRFIFYDGARFVDAWWASSKEKLEGIRAWTEAELVTVLAQGHYSAAVVGNFAQGVIGEFSEIPEAVLRTAPPLAQRFQELLGLLADGTRELELVRLDDWFLWCREGRWYWGKRVPCGPYGSPSSCVRAMKLDFALELIEETLLARPDVQPLTADPALVAEGNAAIDKAVAALPRLLYGGEVWEEGLDASLLVKPEDERSGAELPAARRLRFARGVKLYRADQLGQEPLASVVWETEESVLEDLVQYCARGGDPRIGPERPDHQLPATSGDSKA